MYRSENAPKRGLVFDHLMKYIYVLQSDGATLRPKVAGGEFVKKIGQRAELFWGICSRYYSCPDRL